MPKHDYSELYDAIPSRTPVEPELLNRAKRSTPDLRQHTRMPDGSLRLVKPCPQNPATFVPKAGVEGHNHGPVDEPVKYARAIEEAIEPFKDIEAAARLAVEAVKLLGGLTK